MNCLVAWANKVSLRVHDGKREAVANVQHRSNRNAIFHTEVTPEQKAIRSVPGQSRSFVGLNDRIRKVAEEARSKALELQAREYDRHFVALNGEQARIAAFATTLVSREKFDDYVANHAREMSDRYKQIDTRFGKIERQLAVYSGGLFVLMIVIKFIWH